MSPLPSAPHLWLGALARPQRTLCVPSRVCARVCALACVRVCPRVCALVCVPSRVIACVPSRVCPRVCALACVCPWLSLMWVIPSVAPTHSRSTSHPRDRCCSALAPRLRLARPKHPTHKSATHQGGKYFLVPFGVPWVIPCRHVIQCSRPRTHHTAHHSIKSTAIQLQLTVISRI